MEQKKIGRIIYMVAGPLMMAFAVNCIYEPADMVTGGVSGIAIVVQRVTSLYIEGGISVGLTNMLINLALFGISYYVLGRKTVLNMIFSSFVFSVALFVIPTSDYRFETYAMASVFGGIINGIGLGLVFLAGTSTGGTELVGAMLHRKWRNFSVTSILLVIDAAVVLTGYFVFGTRPTFYSIIAIVVTMKVADIVMSGFNYCKMVYVISGKGKEISNIVINELHRGATGIKVKGMYTGNEQIMLLCIIRPKEMSKFMEIVSRIDEAAFVIISDAREVMGEGFLPYRI